MKALLILGALNAALAVVCGAFGAHGLKARVEASLLETWATASEYHFFHALALLLVGVLAAVFAPLGAALAHRLHQQTLKYVFAAFLVLVGCNMVWKVLASQG